MSARRLFVTQGYGRSLGNMIDVLSGEQILDDSWIEVEREEVGIYRIVGDNFTHPDKDDWICHPVALGMCAWTDNVEDKDEGSDEKQCFDMSQRLLWQDVEIDLSYKGPVIRAPSFERIKEALRRIVFCAWCPGDI